MKKYFISNKFDQVDFDDNVEWDFVCYLIYFVLILAIIYLLSYSQIFSKNANPGLALCIVLIVLLVLYNTLY